MWQLYKVDPGETTTFTPIVKFAGKPFGKLAAV